MSATEDLINYIKGGNGEDDTEAPELLRRFVAAGADIHAEAASNGKNALMHAIYYDSAHMIDTLFELGARHDVPAKDGWLPLHRAAYDGRYEACLKLLAQGADVNAAANDDKKYPVSLALRNNFGQVGMLLLDHGADPHVIHGGSRSTLLHLATGCDDLDLLDLLKDAGLDLNARNANGMTPAHICALKGHGPQLVRLLALGADPDLTVEEGADKLLGLDALGIAIQANEDETVNILRAVRAQRAASDAVAEIQRDIRSGRSASV